ncbi:hypothetical protein R1sor_010543 [Riccia sorocarpa]|uniref:Uncharacterized protein n=1 Tax=Riccia sorocarpa TaxID=122646 RepID=A0ABD3HYC0_9MARC
MSGYERNYDFADLIDCASGLNRLASMEYGEEKLNMGKSHAKQQTIWGKLHPLVAVGHEARHVMSEVLQQVCSEEEVKKFNPMVVYDGHSIYKATLVSQLVGNPTLSKDRLTRIKQSVYFNGVKQRPMADGVHVCILDIGYDCAVLFDTEGTTGEGSSCQVLFNWYSPLRNSREKFTYDHTDLQWIDLESVISVVRMKVEHNVRTVWCLDRNDRSRIDEFVQSL